MGAGKRCVLVDDVGKWRGVVGGGRWRGNVYLQEWGGVDRTGKWEK